MDKDGRWYLVQCKPREGFRAEQHLMNQGYTCFHPTHPVKQKIGRRLTTVQQSLFPHYLFICLSSTDAWSPIRSTRGVSRLVSFNGVPASLDDGLVQAIQQHCEMLHGKQATPLFIAGGYRHGDRRVF